MSHVHELYLVCDVIDLSPNFYAAIRFASVPPTARWKTIHSAPHQNLSAELNTDPSTSLMVKAYVEHNYGRISGITVRYVDSPTSWSRFPQKGLAHFACCAWARPSPSENLRSVGIYVTSRLGLWQKKAWPALKIFTGYDYTCTSVQHK
jgi:hypothetical protein